MLAYVFWHWRHPDVVAAAYERMQAAFHAALRATPPPGFLSSASLAVRGAPWANGGGEAYEDWYLVRDSAALDPLNESAVTASRRAAHDAAAAAAAGGTAGLYALRLGTAPERPAAAAWFAKPVGTRYDDVWREVEPLARSGQGALWMRRLVLGPGPEFCLQTVAPVNLPPAYAPLRIALLRVL